MYGIILNHPELKPYEWAIELRMRLLKDTEKRLLDGKSLNDFANAHHYFGFHRVPEGWVYREWAPAAEQLWLTGDFNEWSHTATPMKKLEQGCWEVTVPADTLKVGSRVKTLVKAFGNVTEHIPLYARRVVQDEKTRLWCCELTDDAPYAWTDGGFSSDEPCIIYEAHVGMSSEEAKVNTYLDFADNVLPRIQKAGYTTIQLMAIMEHPYYGSFGYQVSNFFAPASRFGTPDELKYLVNKAHSMGIRVLLDLVHSHAVKNTAEGINLFDGTAEQFFMSGQAGEHPSWGTKCFNYGKHEVIHFLLSNLKYWMEEYHFDGFRFDGVTSMLYWSHNPGGEDGLAKYFTTNVNTDAVTYLQLANLLIHEVNPKAVTIAEDVSCMAGISTPVAEGGIGFDYRLAMGEPDLWVKLVKNTRDEDWNMEHMYLEMTFRNEPTIGYVECHDQALVGDQTLMFRMCGAAMYDSMEASNQNAAVERAMALHKMSRLLTLTSGGDGYLNFMGNEFGHPEWIDFPREGNGWSCAYARRQWSLADNGLLKYHYLNAFDHDMIWMARNSKLFLHRYPTLKRVHNSDHVLAYEHMGLLFVFNFDPTRSYDGYPIPVSQGDDYEVVMSTDDVAYGGQGRVGRIPHSAMTPGMEGNNIRLYLPCRTAIVLKPVHGYVPPEHPAPNGYETWDQVYARRGFLPGVEYPPEPAPKAEAPAEDAKTSEPAKDAAASGNPAKPKKQAAGTKRKAVK